MHQAGLSRAVGREMQFTVIKTPWGLNCSLEIGTFRINNKFHLLRNYSVTDTLVDKKAPGGGGARVNERKLSKFHHLKIQQSTTSSRRRRSARSRFSRSSSCTSVSGRASSALSEVVEDIFFLFFFIARAVVKFRVVV